MATPLRGCVRYFLGKAKDIILRPIGHRESNELVRRVHYSGIVKTNSQIHIGVFYQGKLEGAMQFGPPQDTRKLLPLVAGSIWSDLVELNRMAFSDVLPRNSESRALGVAMRILKKHAAQVKWVVSFADGAQCGDGTIYRAAGFVLTAIKENDQIWQAPTGERFSRLGLTNVTSKHKQARAVEICRAAGVTGQNILSSGRSSMDMYRNAGFKPIPGFQLRYMYFLDPTARERLTVPILPFSEIERRGAGMYKGQPRAASIDSDAAGLQPADGGATPTAALQQD